MPGHVNALVVSWRNPLVLSRPIPQRKVSPDSRDGGRDVGIPRPRGHINPAPFLPSPVAFWPAISPAHPQPAVVRIAPCERSAPRAATTVVIPPANADACRE